MITISKKEYLSLLVTAEVLTRLEIGGVDNWEWYGESLNNDDLIDLDTWKTQEEIRISKMEDL